MRVRVFAKNVALDGPVAEFIERQLGFALDRFATRVSEVVVRLGDLNGPRGGIDQHCRIDARITPSARKVVQARGATMEAAICQAVDRIGRVVRDHLQRRRAIRVRASRRAAGRSGA